VLRPDRPLNLDSGFFDFRGKVTTVVEHFGKDGLTLKDYLRAALLTRTRHRVEHYVTRALRQPAPWPQRQKHTGNGSQCLSPRHLRANHDIML
jgi:hypothetical protein